jgi:hypothetical protein
MKLSLSEQYKILYDLIGDTQIRRVDLVNLLISKKEFTTKRCANNRIDKWLRDGGLTQSLESRNPHLKLRLEGGLNDTK